jgi:hypothetical protein
MHYFKIGSDTFEVDNDKSYICERTEEYKTFWDIKITAKEALFDGTFLCGPSVRGDSVIVPEFCLAECQRKAVDLDDNFACEDEDVPFSIYVSEHTDVYGSVITFGTINNSIIDIRWTGKADLFWSKELQKEVPFEICCSLKIKSYISNDAFVSPSLFIIDRIQSFHAADEDDREEIFDEISDILESTCLTDRAIDLLLKFTLDGIAHHEECADDFSNVLYCFLSNTNIPENKKQRKRLVKMHHALINNVLVKLEENFQQILS